MPDRRYRLLGLTAALAVVISGSGCGTTKDNVERGRTLFRQKCGTCHELAQAGTSAQVGPNLDDAFAAARAAGETNTTIAGVVKSQVENPRPSTTNPAVSMPAGLVSGQDLEDVAAYVGEYAGVPGAHPPRVPGGPGAQVFANNGCGTCHTLAAAEAGGTVGPNLDEVLPGVSAKEVETDIVDPNAKIAKGYPAGVMPQNFEQILTSKELSDLVQYLVESTSGGNAGKRPGGKSKAG